MFDDLQDVMHADDIAIGVERVRPKDSREMPGIQDMAPILGRRAEVDETAKGFERRAKNKRGAIGHVR